jgi:hypothetical protein
MARVEPVTEQREARHADLDLSGGGPERLDEAGGAVRRALEDA